MKTWNQFINEAEAIQYSYITDEESSENLPEDWENQLQQIQRNSGINILSNKDLAVVAHDDKQVLGALYTSFDNSDGEYSFDIVGEQGGNWVGMNLIKIGLDSFHDYSEYHPEAHIKLDVRNKRLVPILQKKFGLKIVNTDPNGAVIMSP